MLPPASVSATVTSSKTAASQSASDEAVMTAAADCLLSVTSFRSHTDETADAERTAAERSAEAAHRAAYLDETVCSEVVHPLELRLENTLENGQCFGWRRQPGDSSEPVWVGVLGEHVLALRQTEDDCMFRCVGGPAVAAKDAVAAAAEEAAVVTQLRDYFQLDEPLRPLYSHWAAADHRMAAVAEVVPGMRVLRQDPAECLFSFICSSNNNIGRIGGMLQNLRAMYGTPIPTVDAPVGAPAEAEAAEAQPDRYLPERAEP